MLELLNTILLKYNFIVALIVVAIMSAVAQVISRRITKGRIHSSAIAILFGLFLAFIGGEISGGSKGISDVFGFSGFAIIGGSTIRDFAIVSTAFGADVEELKKCGKMGVISLFIGITISFISGAIIAVAAGIHNVEDVVTLGAGAVSFIVGPVTGSTLGSSNEIIAISIGMGVVKSIAVMILTPVMAEKIGLTTPKSAVIFGGLMGTTSGTSAGLAAVNAELVPYAAMTATFFTGLGCLLCPSVFYFIVKLILG